MTLILAGDMGGTNTRLRLEQRLESGEWQQLGDDRIYKNKEYRDQGKNHLHIIQDFLEERGGVTPQAACLAIAGPVADNHVVITNLKWTLNAPQMESHFKIPHIRLINDFVAVGYGILALDPEKDIEVLQLREPKAQAPMAVLGAGTGLGEALLFWNGTVYDVLPTEGGHANFAPRSDNELEIGLLGYLGDRYRDVSQGHVSVERVVSGHGIQAIYAYLSGADSVSGLPSSEEIVKNAPQNALYQRTLDLFVAAYGAEAGNLALKSLPRGGLYVSGAIAAEVLSPIKQPQLRDLFIKNFLDSGRMRSVLEEIKVSLITNPLVGLMGAAIYARRLV